MVPADEAVQQLVDDGDGIGEFFDQPFPYLNKIGDKWQRQSNIEKLLEFLDDALAFGGAVVADRGEDDDGALGFVDLRWLRRGNPRDIISRIG